VLIVEAVFAQKIADQLKGIHHIALAVEPLVAAAQLKGVCILFVVLIVAVEAETRVEVVVAVEECHMRTVGLDRSRSVK